MTTTARLAGLLEQSGFTRLVADYISAEVASEPDCAVEEGWRIHDFPPAHGDPKRPEIAHFIAEGLEEGEAKFLVAAVNALPELLARIAALEACVANIHAARLRKDGSDHGYGWNITALNRAVDAALPLIGKEVPASDLPADAADRMARAAFILNRSENDAG